LAPISAMSALGQKRSFVPGQLNVRFAPIEDIERVCGRCGNGEKTNPTEGSAGLVRLREDLNRAGGGLTVSFQAKPDLLGNLINIGHALAKSAFV
jgi:hypothetical protein